MYIYCVYIYIYIYVRVCVCVHVCRIVERCMASYLWCVRSTRLNGASNSRGTRNEGIRGLEGVRGGTRNEGTKGLWGCEERGY